VASLFIFKGEVMKTIIAIKRFFQVLVLFNKLGSEEFLRILSMGAKEELHHVTKIDCKCAYCSKTKSVLGGDL
jgi:hypothetical protein